ncbi:hypothetical protein HDU93_001239, partial [Gonapodya sp. JEL0774]
LFRNVTSAEYLDFIWKTEYQEGEAGGMSPGLNFFVERFNKESRWVATEICSVKNDRTRRKLLKKFILVAKRCAELNNFFSAFAILGGLNHSAVRRLKRTLDLSDKYTGMVAELDALCDPSRNMKHYRDRIALCKPPTIPFLAIFFKDLTFLNDGNKSYVQDLINFEKLRMMAARVQQVQQLCLVQYPFVPVTEVQNYIACPPMISDEKKLLRMSAAIEPYQE